MVEDIEPIAPKIILKRKKVVLLGPCNAGKTDLVKGLLPPVNTDDVKHKKKVNRSANVHELNVSRISMSLDNSTGEYEIWDLPGQKIIRTEQVDDKAKAYKIGTNTMIAETYMRGADAALIVFDISNAESLARIPSIIHTFKLIEPKALIIVIGNKSDLLVYKGPKEREEIEIAVNSMLDKFAIPRTCFFVTNATQANSAQSALTELHKQMLLKHEIKPDLLRCELIDDLTNYLEEKEDNKNQDGQVIFNNFWFFPTFRGLSQKANYHLAQQLLKQLSTTDDSIHTIFSRIGDLRREILTMMYAMSLYHQNLGIYDSTLNAIIKKALTASTSNEQQVAPKTAQP